MINKYDDYLEHNSIDEGDDSDFWYRLSRKLEKELKQKDEEIRRLCEEIKKLNELAIKRLNDLNSHLFVSSNGAGRFKTYKNKEIK